VPPIKLANSITRLELSSKGVPVKPNTAFLHTNGLFFISLSVIPSNSRPARLFFSLKNPESLPCVASFAESSSVFVVHRLCAQNNNGQMV
jgi:hypothetical protein